MSVVGEEDQIPALTMICTYDSLDKIQETRKTRYAVPLFDLAIMDEAHHIAGRPDRKWAAVHDNQRIRADRRLYMPPASSRPPNWPSPPTLPAPAATPPPPPARPGASTSPPPTPTVSEGPDHALRTTALHLAVLRAMRDHDLKKVLVYFNLVDDASLFARELRRSYQSS
uniref:hypothetical protein n=1 Tax=Streptomyces sp. NRRL S-325 TaxID=1463899 RepID=UPI00055ABDC4|nr:hypothetical protein [Streptomyces sp. NRRL S-325]